MPPHIIIIGMPAAIMAFIRWHISVIISMVMPSVGIMVQTMPLGVISQLMPTIGIMPFIPIMGFMPIIGFIIGIMPPIIGMGIIIGIMPGIALPPMAGF